MKGMAQGSPARRERRRSRERPVRSRVGHAAAILTGSLLLGAGCVLPAGAGQALAQEALGACDVTDDLLADGESGLYQVRAGRSRLHFLKGGDEKTGCPQENAGCTARAYLLPGDPVVVTRTEGNFVCAGFAPPKQANAVTSGWLPAAALDLPQAASGAVSEWLGRWHSGAWKQIDITAAPNGGITLEGSASYGADDPARRERGAVNTGEIAATVTPQGGRADFSLDVSGEVRAYDATGDDVFCKLRLRQLGPYLAVTDNAQCGGHNVTFTGIYRRAGKAEKPKR